MSIKPIIEAVAGVAKLRKWLQRMWDAAILDAIANENAICTFDFIGRAVPGRSRNSISNSLRRLIASGDICRAGIGYASRDLHAAIKVTIPGWSS